MRNSIFRKYRLVGLAVMICISVTIGYWSYRIWRSRELNALSKAAHEFADQSKWGELAPVAERWSTLEPERAEPWLMRAQAAEETRDWGLVAKCLDRIPRDDRRALPALVRKAEIEFENLNRPWDGLKTCDEILQIEPRVLVAHKQSIFFCAMTLQRAELVRRIRRAIRVRRESPESYVYLASASWFYSAALFRHNTRWLEADPDNETFQVARALQIYISEAKENLQEASNYKHIPPVEVLLQRFPHNIELLSYLIDLAIENGDATQVEELLAAFPPQIADLDARVWRARSWLADITNDLPSAMESLKRAFAIDPYWWRVHFQMYDVLRRLGRRDESDQFLKLYDSSLLLGKTIASMNFSERSFDDVNFRSSLLILAELIGDGEVIAVLRERLVSR